MSPGNVNCPDPSPTTASSVAPGLAADADRARPHTPPIGVPVPVSVTVAVIEPRVGAMAGSASTGAPAVTVTRVGAPKNPEACPPVGSIAYT